MLDVTSSFGKKGLVGEVAELGCAPLIEPFPTYLKPS